MQTPSGQHPARVHAILVALLTAVTLSVFAYTVEIRRPYFGDLSEDPHGHQWLTASTLIWAKNWYREGAFHLKFALLDNPKSIEFPTLASRAPYVSYPPGSTLPIHLLATLRGREPTPGLVMGYNLLNHLMIAWLLAVTVYVVLVYSGFAPIDAALFAVIPPLIELLSPGPIYFHQAVYAMDTAVLMPFALALFLEVAREKITHRRLALAVDILQGIVFFFGYLTDWLFVLVGVTFFVKRLATGEISPRAGWRPLVVRSLIFWAPAAISAALFLMQVTYLDGWSTLLDRAAERTGMQSEKNLQSFGQFADDYFGKLLPLGYGSLVSWLLLGSLAVLGGMAAWLLVRRVRRQPVPTHLGRLLWALALVNVPCFAHMLLLWQHSGHPFSSVKFALPLALGPLVLLPAAGTVLVRWRSEGQAESPTGSRDKKAPPPGLSAWYWPRLAVLHGALLLVLLGILVDAHPGYKKWLRAFAPDPRLPTLQREFGRVGIGPNDVVVSPTFAIPRIPPHRLAYTMKRVYHCKTDAEVHALIEDIPPPFRLVVLRLDANARVKQARMVEVK